MRPDGSEVVSLTADGADNREPDWSLDGSQQTRLTQVVDKIKRTTWSPDGKRIVFQSTRTGHWQICTINIGWQRSAAVHFWRL